MYTEVELLEMITDKKPSTRYDACEMIRIRQESSPQIVTALLKATQDENRDVVERAILALSADVHRQMAEKMGIWKSFDKKSQAGEIQAGEIEEAESVKIEAGIAAMLKEIQSWGLWSLGLGIMHFFSAGFLSAPWGVLLLVVGLASFLFRTSSMFIIYAVTIAWAGISNIVSLGIPWAIFGLLQIYLAVRVILRYRKFRTVESDYLDRMTDHTSVNASAKRACRFFPWIGSLLSCSSITALGILLVIAIIFAMASETAKDLPGYFAFIEGVLVNMGVLGFSLGLASLLSRYRLKALAILGMIVGFLTVAIELGLGLLGNAGG